MPNHTTLTSVTRRLFTLTLAASILVLAGFGCKTSETGENPSQWTPAQQVYLDNWPTTTEKMQKFLNATTEVVAKTQPDRIVVAQIAFQNDLPASEVIHWFMKFPSSSFVTFYVAAGKIGGGFYNFRPESPATEAMIQTFKDLQQLSFSSTKESYDRWKKRCATDPQDSLCPIQLPREQEAYNAESARNEKFVYGLDLRGPARDLDAILSDPRTFSIQIESGSRPRGNPFYKETEVNQWRP